MFSKLFTQFFRNLAMKRMTNAATRGRLRRKYFFNRVGRVVHLEDRITPVAPINTVPVAQSIAEDTNLAIMGTSVADNDGDLTSVQLSVVNGTLSLTASGGGIVGGNGTNTVTVTGTQAGINSTIATINYLGNLNFNGSDTLTVLSTDGIVGDATIDTDTDTVAITVSPVNDAPVNSVPGLQTTNEDTATAISGVSVNDVDGNLLSTMLTVTNGVLNVSLAGGAAISAGANNSATLTLTGTQPQINAALATIMYTPNSNFNGSDNMQVLSTDTNGATDTDNVPISVTAVNDGPVVTAPATVTTNEDTPFAFTGANTISVNDVDVAAGNLSTTLTVTNGTLSMTGGTGNGTSTVTFTGTQAATNAALATLVYTPTSNFNGSASLSTSVNDNGNSGTGGPQTGAATTAITVTAVNDAPVVTAPATVSTNEDTPFAFTGANTISVNDVDVAAGNLSTTLTVTNGTLSMTGGTGNGTSTVTFTGNQAATNAALATLVYTPTPNFNGSASLVTSVNDNGNTGTGGAQTGTATTAITVGATNDAPVVTAPATVTTNEDTPFAFTGANTISVTDSDVGAGNLSTTLTVTNGTLSMTGGTGNGTSTVTFTGTQAATNTALATLVFTPTSNFNGSASLVTSVNDNGNTGTGGAQTGTATTAITVTAVNDAPVVTAPATVSTNEDTPFAFTGGNTISVNDVDVAAGSLSTTLTVTNGTLSMTGGTGNGTSTVTFTGNQAATNAALATLVYTPTSNFNGSASLVTSVNDNGNTGTGGAQTGTATTAITVGAVNDAPVVTAPATVTTNEDTPFAFTGANTISVTDSDVGAGTLTATLTVTNGTLSMTGGTGNGTSTVTFTGTQAATNAALATLVYTPTSNFNGSASLVTSVNDNGNTGTGGAQTGTATTAITVTAVNDAPVVTAPATVSTGEDTPFAFTGANTISVNDVDVAAGNLSTTLTVTNGTLSMTGGTGNGTSTVTFTGTQAATNAALATLVYTPTPNFTGSASLSTSINDNGNTGTGGAQTGTATTAITVGATNDAPVVTAPATVSTGEDTPFAFTGGNTISVTDSDVGAGTLTSTLTVTNGTLSMTGGTGNGTSTVTFTGTQAATNAALATLVYTPTSNFNGSASLVTSVNDNGNTGTGGAQTGTATTAITVGATNDAPVVTAPATVSTGEDTPFAFTGANTISVTDSDVGAGNLSTTLTVTNGTLSMTGGTGNGTSTVTFTGTQAATNTALATLVSTPTSNFSGSASLVTSVNDNGNTGTGGAQTGTATTAITVGATNDAPVVTAPATVTTNEDTPFAFTGANTISVTDSDVGAGTLTSTLTVTNGTLSMTGGTGNGTSTVTFTGTQAATNAALATLVYTPTSNFNGSASLVTSVNDNGNTGTGGAQTGTATTAITVGATNDAPVVAGPATVSTNEDTPFAFTGANTISVTDADVGAGSLSTTVTATNGTLSMTGGTGNGTSTVTFTGNQAATNAALATLVYTPTLNFNGPATVMTSVNDNGNTGGAAQTGTLTTTVNVGTTNDAPSVTAPANYFATEQLSLNLKNSGISVSDVDAGANNVTLQIQVATGTLSATAGTSGVVLGGGGSTLLVTGTIAQINDFLNTNATSTLSYLNSSDAPPPAVSMTFLITDNLGATGGAVSSINIAPVNDAPTGTVPVYPNATEQVNLSLKNAGLQVADVDAAAGIVTATLTVTQGTLTATIGDSGVTIVSGNGTSTLVVSGTLAQVNSLFGAGGTSTLNYNSNSDTPPASATLTLTVNDNGNTGSGGAQTSTPVQTVITITSVNDAPANTFGGSTTFPAAPLTTNEDTNLVFTGASAIQTSDAEATTLQVTLSATNGTVTLSGMTGLAFATGDGTADPTMTFTGSTANVNAALNNMFFTPNPFFNGAASVTITTSDLGVSPAPAATDTDTVNITVGAVNNAPAVDLNSGTAGNNNTVAFTQQTPVQIAPAGTITDVDSANLTSLVVTLTNRPDGNAIESLGLNAAATAAAAGLTVSYNSTTGVLSITGAAPTGTYQTILDGVEYRNTSASPNTADRIITVVASDGTNSSTSRTATVQIVGVNDAPILTGPANSFTPITEDVTNPAGNSVAELLAGGRQSDPDGPGALQGIAVTATSPAASGTWQYSLDNGSTWNNVEPVSNTSALLLRSQDRLRFLPDQMNGGLGSVTYRAWDQTGATTGQQGTRVSTATNGGTSPFSTNTLSSTITVASINDAPTVTPPPVTIPPTPSGAGNNLTTVTENDTNSAGDPVSTLIFNPDHVFDVDFGASYGIAVIGQTQSGPGTFQFSIDNGTTWLPIGTVSNTSALLLRSNDRVRFRPDGISGATGTLTYRAWDQTSGAPGTLADTTVNGGTTAFSANTLTSNATITETNDAPVLTAPGNSFTPITEDQNPTVPGPNFPTGSTANGGNSVASLIAGRVTDTDSGFVTGIAITNTTVTPGAVIGAPAGSDFSVNGGRNLFQYSLDGGVTWISIAPNAQAGAATEASAILLRSQDLIRFLPDGITPPSAASITFRAWDQSNGAGLAGTRANTVDLASPPNPPNSNNGGNTPYSDATATSSITVTAVNDAPMTNGPATATANEDVLTPISGYSVTDAEIPTNQPAPPAAPLSATTPVQLALSVTNGTLTLGLTPAQLAALGLTFTQGDGTADPAMTFSGTLNNVNTALASLQFQGNPSFSGTAVLTITANDLGTAPAPAASSTRNVNITVVSIDNDLPVNTFNGSPTFPAGPLTASEDTNMVFNAANGRLIQTSDQEATTIQVTLTAVNGVVFLRRTAGTPMAPAFPAGLTVVGDGTSMVTATGTQALVNAALDGLIFRGNSNVNNVNAANGSLTITTSDLGASPGPAQTDTDTVQITIAPVNDAPVINGPATNITPPANVTLAATEDTPFFYSSTGTPVSVTDVDINEGFGVAQVTITATNGTSSLGTIGGLTFQQGDGTNDQTMTFSGSLGAINTALSTLSFTGSPDYNGPASVVVTANDLGNFPGPQQTGSRTFHFTVGATNDAPTFTRGPNVAVTIRQTANTPTFSIPAPAQQTITGWATNVSAGPGESVLPPGGTNTQNAQTVTFTVTVLSNPGLFASTPTVTLDPSLSTASLNFTPAAGQFGSSVLQVTATDGLGATSAPQIFVITIDPDRPATISEPPAPQANVPQPKVRLGQAKTNIAGGFSISSSPAVAVADTDGRYVVVWTTDVGVGLSNVFFQLYSATGAPIVQRQVSTTPGTNSAPAVAMDDSGDFVVVWNGSGISDSNGVYGRRFDANGNDVGGPTPFLINTTVAGSQSAPAVTMDLDGDFVVAWQGNGDGFGTVNDDPDGIFFQRFNNFGGVNGGETLVNTSTVGVQAAPSISDDAFGNFAVVWNGAGASGTGIYGRRFDNGGAAGQIGTGGNTNAFLISAVNTGTTTQLAPSVAMDAVGDFVVAWPTLDSSAGTVTTQHFQRFALSGLATGSTANFAVINDVSFSNIAIDNDGDFVIVWDDVTGVTARRWNVNGTPISPFFNVTSTDTVAPRVGSDGNGDFVVTWARAGIMPGLIEAQQYASNEAPNSLTFNSSTAPFVPNSTTTPENATTLGAFALADNNPDDVFIYTFAADNSNGAFAVNSFGVMSVADPSKFNYETAPITGPGTKGYTVTVRATDSNGLWRTQDVVITITDVNEAPTDIQLSNPQGTTPPNTIPEHSPNGTVVGSLTTTDPDQVDDTLTVPGNPAFSTQTYSITSQTGVSGPVSIFTVIGNQIRVADSNALEFENAFTDANGRFYNVTVRSTDGGGLTFDKTFKIYVSLVGEPTITSVVFGPVDVASPNQRSRIDQIVVNFSEAINTATVGAGAFSLVRTGPTGGSMPINTIVTWSNGNTTATITFFGPGVEVDNSPGATGGSLVDGNYTFNVNGNQIFTQTGNRPVDANGDGIQGGTRTQNFFRLFGDIDGNRQVDNVDFFHFKNALGSSVGSPNYREAFDFNGDGLITNVDFFQFRLRLGQPPLPPSP